MNLTGLLQDVGMYKAVVITGMNIRFKKEISGGYLSRYRINLLHGVRK